MNVLITGAKGQLGQSIRKAEKDYPGINIYYTDVEELDITDPAALDLYFAGNRPDYVVNCAAYTAVDKAEEDADKARLINETAVANLAACSARFDFTLIHISTDYVFSGRYYRPYTEDDEPQPESVYSMTKRAGELALMERCTKGIILRTSWLYSEFGNNFLKTVLRLASERDELNIIYDQVGTPTYAGDLAKAILEMILRGYSDKSILHFSNEGVASWYDFGRAIVEMSGLKCTVNPILTEDYPLPAKRPYYSLMSKQRFRKEFRYEIPYWRDSLAKCMNNLRKTE